jgi:hypothetical protein
MRFLSWKGFPGFWFKNGLVEAGTSGTASFAQDVMSFLNYTFFITGLSFVKVRVWMKKGTRLTNIA